MRFDSLPVLILHQIRYRAVKHTGAAQGNSRRMAPSLDTITTSLKPVYFNVPIVKEGMENTNSIRPATHTGSHPIGQAPRKSLNLLPRL